ncbi:hypothetical protein CDAR_254511 [Caerostris darwini]|uniref:Uncharacterized protein n=1 Tax=Caerostris darwini TaxID=1538125 RepID=A0AAV4UB62_9ARAC|nr:hypothetical protein CDAR_254511 [Caerostris darwini]
MLPPERPGMTVGQVDAIATANFHDHQIPINEKASVVARSKKATHNLIEEMGTRFDGVASIPLSLIMTATISVLREMIANAGGLFLCGFYSRS